MNSSENTPERYRICFSERKRASPSDEVGLDLPQSNTYSEHLVDLASDSDLSELLEWCRLHWTITIRRSIDTANPVCYHECCNAFSKRGFAKHCRHPRSDTISILKINGFKEMTNASDFFNWMIKKLQLRQKLGQKMLFPRVNVCHTEQADSQDMEDEILGKRLADLQLKLKDSLERIRKLETDNSQLLASSQWWHEKYSQSLKSENFADDEMSYLMTPKKKVRDISGSESKNLT